MQRYSVVILAIFYTDCVNLQEVCNSMQYHATLGGKNGLKIGTYTGYGSDINILIFLNSLSRSHQAWIHHTAETNPIPI